jgi:hypothetical protein
MELAVDGWKGLIRKESSSRFTNYQTSSFTMCRLAFAGMTVRLLILGISTQILLFGGPISDLLEESIHNVTWALHSWPGMGKFVPG